jgi:hypothetical protein
VISLCPGDSRLVQIRPGRKAVRFGVGNQRESAEWIGTQLLGQSWDKVHHRWFEFLIAVTRFKGHALAAVACQGTALIRVIRHLD